MMLHMPASINLACNEGERVSPFSIRQSLALFMGGTTNYCCQKQHRNCRFKYRIRCEYLLCLFYCVSPLLNTLISELSGSASQAQRRLTTGIARRQFLSLRGPTWRNNGRSAWKGSRFEYHCRILRGEYWYSRGDIIKIKADLSGLVVTMHSGLCKQYVQSLGLTASGSDFLFATRRCVNRPLQNRP